MKYENMEKAIFLERSNRFIALVKTSKGEEVCHVKNTGRCKELLIPGVTIYVQRNENPNRKTALDLIGVEKGDKLINMDSQAPNQVVKEWLLEGNICSKEAKVRPEFTYGKSRIDFFVEDGERKILIEVKGVTLENEGLSRFPDAPTERGKKHVEELIQARKDGYEAYILFVIQMKGVYKFQPNNDTQPEFGAVLQKAEKKGVHILAVDCIVEKDSLKIDREIEVELV